MDEMTIPFLGPERVARQDPFGDLLRSGARLAAGSDWAVSSANPLWRIHTAVTRTLPAGCGEPWKEMSPPSTPPWTRGSPPRGHRGRGARRRRVRPKLCQCGRQRARAGDNWLMRDKPEAPGGDDRDPLADLRERLARMPAGHPSSPDYRPAQEPADGSDRGGEGDGLGGEESAGDGEAAGETAAGAEREPEGPHRPGAPRPEDTGRGRPDQPRPRGQGSGLPRPGEPYRPWFSSGDGPQPWFSPESGDRSA
jgi:Amidohydrolase family